MLNTTSFYSVDDFRSQSESLNGMDAAKDGAESIVSLVRMKLMGELNVLS